MKRRINLEQFFTTNSNATFCLSKINLSDYDTVIEPSAGSGAFSNKIKNCLAFDINPLGYNIKKCDFLELDTSGFLGNTLVIGNPPFGRQSSLAVKFINKSAEFAKTIAFILPNSFKKESMINRLNEHLHLEYTFSLPDTKFVFDNESFEIPCSFFIFEKRADKRKKLPLPKINDFVFCKKEEADSSIRRVGFYSGRIEKLDVSESSHYFVKWKTETAMKNFEKLEFEFDNTVGPRSLSKTEIIRKYYEEFEKNRD